MRFSHNNNSNIIERIIAILIISSPILGCYNLPFLFDSIGTLFALILCLLTFIDNLIRDNFSIRKAQRIFLYFLLWSIFITIISQLRFYGNSYSGTNSFTFLITNVLTVVFIIGINDHLSSSIKHYYFIAVYFVVALYLLQFFGYYAFGIIISLKIPFLTIPEEFYNQGLLGVSGSMSLGLMQFSSLFTEKSHFAQYIIPSLVISLFDEGKGWKKSVFQLIISLVLLSSASGVGIVSVFFVWILYYILSKRKGFRLIIALVFLLFLLVFVHNILIEVIPSYSDTAKSLFFKGVSSYSKADYRIYRGFSAFNFIAPIDKIFGIGYRQFADYSNYYGFQESFGLSDNREYLNAISQVLIYFGVIGFIFFIRSLYTIFIALSKNGKILILIFFIISCASSILFESTAMLYITLALSCNVRTEEVSNESI